MKATKTVITMCAGLLWAGGPVAGQAIADAGEATGVPVQLARASRGRTIEGQVARYSYWQHGLVNGFVLDDGTRVYFPPRPLANVAGLLSPGAQVQVSGWPAKIEGNVPVFNASRISRVDGRASDLVVEPGRVQLGLTPGGVG